MGNKRQVLFSSVLNDFVESIRIQETLAGHFPINGHRIRVKGTSMIECEQNITILLLDSEAKGAGEYTFC
jgi:hypothetical protein